ncbi:helix-turn-helix domain-containing protein [Anaerosphaera multitolerans]|uniref:helix-turn-helix domain-containing protein n=1 Tax=Anaerosphaera multitolerans TaxID=2487351 RepID=UPI00196A329A|nr:helix-turn-helix transcriptional regulator [Anaerosphaera multitolerans]
MLKIVSTGERIKELRIKKNLTQEELGKKFGLVKSTISLYESNKSTPDDNIKRALAKYFDVTLDYLMGVSDNPKGEIIKNKKIPENIAAYFDGEEFSDEALRDIEEYIEFVKQKRNKKG